MPIPDLVAAALVVGTIAFILVAAIQLSIFVLNKNEQGNDLENAINDLLPQIQCAQCGYPGCRPYARAVIEGAATNLCLPGGDRTAEQLAILLNREVTTPISTMDTSKIAAIREEECVGCALCLEACPVDAIVGARDFVHTVIPSHCTACELCIPVCPGDCIDMLEPHKHAA